MPEIKPFPRTRVAYVSEVGPYGETIQRGFARLFGALAANNVQPVGAPMGIYYDDPASVAPENLHFDLCVPIAADIAPTDGLRTKEIGGTTVAALTYQGAENIRSAYREVYDWLHANGYREIGAPVETYLNAMGEELRAEIAVPVEAVAELPPPQPPAAKQPVRAAERKAARKPKRRTRKPA